MENQKVYVPFRFRLTPIKRTALIRFKKDPDNEYLSFEIQEIEQIDSDESAFQILAWRQDGFKDVYRQKDIKTDKKEELITVGGRGRKETYLVEFKESYFKIEDNHLKIGFSFYDKKDRHVLFNFSEELDEDSQKLSWLPSVGNNIENPTSLPLFFLYKFDYAKKKDSEVFLSIGGEEHTIDTYAFPKDFSSRINIQYSWETVILNFNENRNAVMPSVNIDENGNVSAGGKTYHYEFVDGYYSLESIVVEHPEHPVEMKFDPPFPNQHELEEAKPLYGEFYIYPDKLGTLTGQYNVVRQNSKAIIHLSFREGWKPESTANYRHIINNLSTDDIIKWYKSYQCTEVVDLNTLEAKVEWTRTNPDRRK